MAAPPVQNWQAQILKGVGAPVTPQNLLFVNDWAKAEGGGATNNPFNTTQPAPGAGSYNRVGVRNYGSPQQGIRATIQTLGNGRYGNILGELRQGDNARETAGALAASPWGTGALVQKMLGGGGSAAPPAAPTAAVAPRPAVVPGAQNSSIRQALSLLGFQAPPQARMPQAPAATIGALAPVAQTQHPSGAPGRVLGPTGGEQPSFLNALQSLAGYEHAPVQINSGYRSTQKQAQLYANRASNPNPVAAPGHSLHEQGLAADGTVGGVPLGTLPAAVLARFGLEKVPGDPVHVQIARR